MALTDPKVRNAKGKDKPYKLSDAEGMYLLVNPNSARYWRLKYRYGGKEKTLALGVYPKVSLAEARKRRAAAKDQLSNGIDPADTRRAEKLSRRIASAESFQAIAHEWYVAKMKEKSERHRSRTLRIIDRELSPYIGTRPISKITPQEVLAVLRRIESRGTIDTAHRAKQTAALIFRYAVSTGRAEHDATAPLKEALQRRRKRHHAAITKPAEVGELLVAIDGYGGTPEVKTALQLSALLFQRPGEIRHMEWAEIDWEKRQWEIPAEKMKMGEPHVVPLSTQAIAHLEALHKLTGRGRYVFPSARGRSRPLSENGVRVALRTMGYSNDVMTAHGFRAMARTLLDEELRYRIDHIEHQLAHTVRDPLGRAYNRTKHLEERRVMMQDWADYLDKLRIQASSDNVVSAKFGK